MDLPFETRTDAQRAEIQAAYERMQQAKRDHARAMSQTTLYVYAYAQPVVCFDDAHGYTQEREDYENAFEGIDFQIADEDENLVSIAWVEMSSEDVYEVWAYDARGDEVFLGRYGKSTTVYY